MKRFAVGDCEMLERKHGSYVEVNELLKRLDDIMDDDHPDVMMEKIEQLQLELGDL